MKIALHGSYYGDNFGDTLFVLHFIKWLENSGVKQNNILLPFAGDRVRSLTNTSNKKGVKALIESDKLVFIGGGYLGEPNGGKAVWSLRLIVRHLSIGILAWLLKKPYILLGVGAGPLSNPVARKLSVFLCNKSEKTVVRDQESYNYLIQYGVDKLKLSVTADSILTFDENNVNKSIKKSIVNKFNEQLGTTENSRIIGLHLPTDHKHYSKVDILVKDLTKYHEMNPNVKYVIFNDFYKPDYTYYLQDEIVKSLDGKEYLIMPYENPEQLIALISSLDTVITTKLHCGIVANALNKDTISVSVHTKTKRLYKQINQEEQNMDISDVKENDLLNLLNKKIVKNDKIPQDVRSAAQLNEDILLNFVNSKN